MKIYLKSWPLVKKILNQNVLFLDESCFMMYSKSKSEEKMSEYPVMRIRIATST